MVGHGYKNQHQTSFACAATFDMSSIKWRKSGFQVESVH